MKIIVEHDDGQREIFQDVTDAFLAARQYKPMAARENAPNLVMVPDVRSWSWGANIRELLKELRQAVVELEGILKETSRGGSG